LYIIGRAASFNTHEEFLSAILFSSISHSFVSGDQSFEGWNNTGGMNASLTELNSLSNLAVLSLKIPVVFFFFDKHTS
jgi:hypothetical protein